MITQEELNKRLRAFDPEYGDDKISRIDEEVGGFNRHFPEEKIRALTIDKYALGTDTDNENNFCWWVEYGTVHIAKMGGFAKKHRLYFSKKANKYLYTKKNYSSAEECFQDIKENLKKLYALVKADALKEYDNIDLPHNQSLKVCYLLNKDKFMPVLDKKHLDAICRELGIDTSGMNSLEKNRAILSAMNENPVAGSWHNAKKAHFFYSSHGFKLRKRKDKKEKIETKSSETEEPVFDGDEVLTLVQKKKQIIFYGPPGTGKTFNAKTLASLLVDNSD